MEKKIKAEKQRPGVSVIIHSDSGS